MSGFFLIPKKGTGGGAEAIPLIVTCSSQFAGTTITASDGTSTLTETCPSSSPYEITFILPNDGTWTISGTYSGTTFTSTIVIEPYETDLEAIPEGSTALPTDDIQTWLRCAGIFDKAYTTISQVLSDASTLQALIASNNAADYMARSSTWASSVTSNSSAMTYIGANDYCSNALLDNLDWLNSICDSTYFESVLNTKVPTMTDATTPSGEVINSTPFGTSYDGWRAFNPSATNGFEIKNAGSNNYIGYIFTNAVRIAKIMIKFISAGKTFDASVKLQSSDDGNTWTDIQTILASDLALIYTEQFVNILNSNSKRYYRLLGDWNTQGAGTKLQFYGRS